MSSSWHRKYQLLAWFLLVTSEALGVTIAPDALSSHRFDSSRQTYSTGFDVDVESSQFDGKPRRDFLESSRGLQQIASRKERIKQRLLTGDGHAALIVSKWMTDAETGGELPADDVTTSATLVDDDNSAAVADDDEEEMSEDALLLDKRGLSTWLLATTLRKCRNKPNDCQRLHTRARSLPLQRRHFYRYFFKNIVFQ